MNISDIPSEHQYMYISDLEYDSFSGAVDTEFLYKNMSMFFMCENCERIWIYGKTIDEFIGVYRKERDFLG